MRRVVVTGLGAVTPLGVGIRHTWKRLLDGHSGIVSIKDRDSRFAEQPCQVAGVVPKGSNAQGGWDASEWLTRDEQRKMALYSQYALAATQEALEDANWMPTTEESKDMTGVCLGSGIGNFDEAFNTSIAYNNGGPNHSVSTACTTGAHSIGDASRFIAHGDADVMVAGGAESCIHPLAIGSFARCRSLATGFNDIPERASRPFDRDRQGFVVAEGAAIVVLEELEHAISRNAHIYAELKGYGCSADAYHITAPHETGRGAFSAMKRALKNAGVPPSKVDYINAHGTSTPIGDAAENLAIKSLFLGSEGKAKASEINVSSTKGAIGHMLGGAGAIEAAFSILAIDQGVLPPTINLDNVTDEFDCNYVPNNALQRNVDVALTNSFGFGGTNSSLCFAKY
ncbi:beta-ketoacyl synthase [Trichophyton tonsurans CBS 112818]|uniref:beta-ketoacyl-[acyl-carrier-protein] synthase I n=1 Tax=Trichophyton tonsurans (strain CBS 112818) TaxID=647933 RepID=F2S4N1_TRIT1|nr:beta-ketoacyl synthase [Trichophyton tonsurans CBS 112818]